MNTNQRKLIAIFAVCAAAIPNFATAVAVSGQGTWESTLQGRDLDGNLATIEAYYDTTLNITWLSNYGYSAPNLNWVSANAWAANLNPFGSDITGWRLPVVTDTGTTGCNFALSGTDCGFNVDTATGEIAHLFHNTLGNLSYYDASGSHQPGYGMSNTGPFWALNFQIGNYWSSTERADFTSDAWIFDTSNGLQNAYDKGYQYYAWAVHTGDVGTAIPSTVPVPAAIWLFGSGLIGVIGATRRKKST